MLRLLESRYPSILGSIGAVFYFYFFSTIAPPAELKDLISSIITIGAMAVGFIATAKSILISIESKESIRQLKELDVYRNILKFSFSAVNWCVALTITAAMMLLMLEHPIDLTRRILFSFGVFLIIGSILACYRTIHIFSKLLNSR